MVVVPLLLAIEGFLTNSYVVNHIGNIQFPLKNHLHYDIRAWRESLQRFLTIFNIFIFSIDVEQLCFGFHWSLTIILGPYHRLVTLELPQEHISERAGSQISLTAFSVYFHLYDPASWRFYCSMENQYFQYQCRSTKNGSEEYFTLNNRSWSNTTTWYTSKSIKICDRWRECCWHFMNIYALVEIEHLFDGLICKDDLIGFSLW